MELEGISVEALADPTLYRRPPEEEEAEVTTKTFLESKHTRATMLRDSNIRTKPKRSRSSLHSSLQTFSFVLFSQDQVRVLLYENIGEIR